MINTESNIDMVWIFMPTDSTHVLFIDIEMKIPALHDLVIDTEMKIPVQNILRGHSVFMMKVAHTMLP
jgi:hypothetical protein